MFGLLKRQPLNNLPIREVPAVVAAPPSLLPCERVFHQADPVTEIDRGWLAEVAALTAAPARYIPKASLAVDQKGYLGLLFPQFALLDPFYDHGQNGIDGTAKAALRDLVEIDRGTPGLGMQDGMRGVAKPGSGICVGYCADFAVIANDRYSHRQPRTATARSKWLDQSGNVLFACYATLPGYIPDVARKAIHKAAEIAEKVGGKLRLVTEAKWILAAEAVGRPAARDPLIVIVKDHTCAYIDRFNCTAREERLAREHAVRI